MTKYNAENRGKIEDMNKTENRGTGDSSEEDCQF